MLARPGAAPGLASEMRVERHTAAGSSERHRTSLEGRRSLVMSASRLKPAAVADTERMESALCLHPAIAQSTSLTTWAVSAAGGFRVPRALVILALDGVRAAEDFLTPT